MCLRVNSWSGGEDWIALWFLCADGGLRGSIGTWGGAFMPQDDAVGSVSEAARNKRGNTAVNLPAKQHI